MTGKKKFKMVEGAKKRNVGRQAGTVVLGGISDMTKKRKKKTKKGKGNNIYKYIYILYIYKIYK